MAEANRDLWLKTVFDIEGGYVNDPNDPGKATNLRHHDPNPNRLARRAGQ
jgi:hypothetical protein